MKRVVICGLCSAVLLLIGAADVKATVYTDNFDAYGDTVPLANGPLTDQNWLRRGEKNVFKVVNQTTTAGAVTLEAPGNPYDGAHGNWWKPNTSDAGTTYQSVSIEFNTGTTSQMGSPYWGSLRLTLNQDIANSGYYLENNGYVMTIRGLKDMWITRVDGSSWVWGGAGAGSAYDTFDADLQANTTYKATFTKDGANFTGKITTLDGTILAQATYTETLAALVGGNTGIISQWGPNYTLDNFSYTLVPEPATMALLGLGCLGLLKRRK